MGTVVHYLRNYDPSKEISVDYIFENFDVDKNRELDKIEVAALIQHIDR